MVWYVRGVSMRIFKWSPYFRVDKESSIVPIWITLPRLPVPFFHKSALFPIARLIGHPLRLDEATTKLKRPSVARIQVEIDVLRDRPEKIWIQMGSKEGYWQKIEYENVPPYCRHRWHIGHEENLCHVHNPELKSIDQQVGKLSDQRKWKQVYVPKSKPSTYDAGPSNTVLQNTSDPPPQQQASLNLPKEPQQQVPLIPQEHTPALESRQTHAQKRVESATAVTPSDDDSDAHSDGDFIAMVTFQNFPKKSGSHPKSWKKCM